MGSLNLNRFCLALQLLVDCLTCNLAIQQSLLKRHYKINSTSSPLQIEGHSSISGRDHELLFSVGRMDMISFWLPSTNSRVPSPEFHGVTTCICRCQMWKPVFTQINSEKLRFAHKGTLLSREANGF